MIRLSIKIALLSLLLLNQLVPGQTLKCFQCSGKESCAVKQIALINDCNGQCVTYRDRFDQNAIIRRCCSKTCDIAEIEKTTFIVQTCSEDGCNGIESDWKVLEERHKRKAVDDEGNDDQGDSSLSCYDCSGHNPDCGVKKSTLVGGCQSCMVYLNANDGNNVIRRCCKSGCGASGTIAEYEGRQAYFCSTKQCNGKGAEANLLGRIESTTSSETSPTTTTIVTRPTTTTTTTVQTSFSCYECVQSTTEACPSMMLNCPMCMISRNENDPTKFDRRCCWWGCGAANSVSTHNGRPTYFCNADKCNGPGSESMLGSITTTTTTTTTVMTTTQSTTVMTTSRQTSFQCYDCSGPSCGKEGSSMSTNCPTCMMYRNENDPTQIERRCCWWACGASNSVSTYNGRPTYFCNADKCNGAGNDWALGSVPTTSTVMTTRTTMTTTTTTVPTTTRKTSFQCYDCSGPTCGKEGSTLSANCPTCMMYRNDQDPTQIERRCCWWACGASNTLSPYNGRETYFCNDDKCNGYGAESQLSPPVTQSTSRTTTSVTTTRTTSSSSSATCNLNCRNGGTLERVDGCFCYCSEYTSGRECEDIDCVQPDIDADICSIDNESLCGESETFAFECRHLCGKC